MGILSVRGLLGGSSGSGAGNPGTVTSVSFTGGLLSVATATTTPAFTVAGTSGGIPYFSAASTWASSALLAADGVVLGGGAGAAPATNAGFTFGPTAGQGITLAAGTATTDVNAQSWTQTWNAAGMTFTGLKYKLTATAYTANSMLLDFGTTTDSHRLHGNVVSTSFDVYVDGPSSGTARILLRGNGAGNNHQIVSVSAGALKLDSYTGGLDFHVSGVPKLTIGTDGNALFGAGANEQKTGIKSLTELTTIAAAATTDTTIQIPANAILIAVSVRVTTVIPTAATFTVIGTTTSTAFNTAAVSTAANSTDKGTAAGAFVNTVAQTVRITPNAQPADNTGRVRVTIHYIEITPPTS